VEAVDYYQRLTIQLLEDCKTGDEGVEQMGR
jgi:hypothetical protein